MPITILVADDDPALVNLLREYLLSGGYTVLEAFNSGTALAMVRDHEPDLVLLDLNMPGVSGLQVLALMREIPEREHMPVLVMSGETSRKLKETLARYSHVSVLEKPIDFSLLESALHTLLGPRRHG